MYEGARRILEWMPWPVLPALQHVPDSGPWHVRSPNGDGKNHGIPVARRGSHRWKPGVLPIVGPRRIGKSTLIEHACNHERVRDHFSQIMCFRQCGARDDRTVATLSDCDVIKHRSRANGQARILVIIELIGGMDEDVWRKL